MQFAPLFCEPESIAPLFSQKRLRKLHIICYIGGDRLSSVLSVGAAECNYRWAFESFIIMTGFNQ